MFAVEFTVRDDALPPHITRVVRTVVIDAPCPADFTFCPGIDASQACQKQSVCDNAATLAALASADQPDVDSKPPEVTMYIPKVSLHEYGSVYVAAGTSASPFAPCYDAAARATAGSLKAAGNINATQFPCAMSASDDVDGDVTAYFEPVTQTIRFDEDFYDVDQHGTGVIPPGEYTYTFKVKDEAGNEATQDVIFQVVLRKFLLFKGIKVGTATYDRADFTTLFRANYAARFAALAASAQPNWVFKGETDVLLANPTADAATGTTSFDLKMTYFEMPSGVVATAADEEATGAPTARRRLLRTGTRRALAEDGVGASLLADLGGSLSSAAAASGSNETVPNVTASSEEGSDSPAVDLDAAKLASITAEINVVGARLTAAFDSLVGVEAVVGDAGGNPSAYKQRVAEYWKAMLVVADASLKSLQAQAQETLRVIDATIAVQQEVLASVVALEVLLKQQQDALAAALLAMVGESSGAADSGDANGGSACEYRDSRGVAEIFFNATKYSYLGSPPPSPSPPPPPHPSPPPNSTATAAASASVGRRLQSHQDDPTEKKNSNLLALAARLLGTSGSTRDEAAQAHTQVEAEAEETPRRKLLRRSSSFSSSSSAASEGGDGGDAGGAAAPSLLSWHGYDILRDGSRPYAPAPTLIARRFVANNNKLIGGMLLHQVRDQETACTGRFAALGAMCRTAAPSKAPFGVDPVFRRPPVPDGGEEALFNVDLEEYIEDYYNVSRDSGSMTPTLDSTSQTAGTPYGFHHRAVAGYPDGFPVFLDIAATRDSAANVVQYLGEGLFIDHLTRSISAQVVTFNANSQQVANALVEFTFNDAGYIDVTSSVTNLNVKWYTEWNDRNGDGVNDGYVQLALEGALAVMIAFAVYYELAEIVAECFEQRSLSRALVIHFSSFGNYMDAANLALQVCAIVVWVNYQLTRRASLNPILRFDVYDNPASPLANFLLPFKTTAAAAASVDNRAGVTDTAAAAAAAAAAAEKLRWELPTDEAGMRALGESVLQINALSETLTLYFFLQGISMLLMLARTLKQMDFQRHLALTGRTVARCAKDLVHFAFVFMLCLGFSAFIGHILIGPTFERMSSLYDTFFFFHFEILIGEGVELFGMLFNDKTVVRSYPEHLGLALYSFWLPLFILMIMFSMILGIIFDSFGEEREDLTELDEPSVLDEVIEGTTYRWGVLRGRHLPHSQLIKFLRAARIPKTSKAAEALAKGLARSDMGVGDQEKFRAKFKWASLADRNPGEVPDPTHMHAPGSSDFQFTPVAPGAAAELPSFENANTTTGSSRLINSMGKAWRILLATSSSTFADHCFLSLNAPYDVASKVRQALCVGTKQRPTTRLTGSLQNIGSFFGAGPSLVQRTGSGTGSFMASPRHSGPGSLRRQNTTAGALRRQNTGAGARTVGGINIAELRRKNPMEQVGPGLVEILQHICQPSFLELNDTRLAFLSHSYRALAMTWRATSAVAPRRICVRV